MLIDSRQMALKSIEGMLGKTGLHISKVDNAEEAIGILHGDDKPDIIITDFNTAASNDAELIREIRKLPGCQFIPIATLSVGAQKPSATPAKRVSTP